MELEFYNRGTAVHVYKLVLVCHSEESMVIYSMMNIPVLTYSISKYIELNDILDFIPSRSPSFQTGAKEPSNKETAGVGVGFRELHESRTAGERLGVPCL